MTTAVQNIIRKIWLPNAQNLWDADVAGEKKFLASLPAPATSAQRSYNHYLCHDIFYRSFKWTIWKVIAFLTIPGFFIFLLLKGCQKVQKTHSDGVFMGRISLQYVRKTIEKECSQWVEIGVLGEMGLTGKDVKFFLPLWFRYFFSPLFILKILMKIARYSWVIRSYSPQIIMTEESTSFQASLMTEYCHRHNIRHYFAQHGEIFFTLRDVLADFDRYYIWDEAYKNILVDLGCPPDREYIAVSPYAGQVPQSSDTEKTVDCTYYLQAEDRASLQQKHEYLSKLRKKMGWKIAVRPHPRYTDMEAFEQIFADFEREDVKQLSFDASLARTKNVLAFYSVVLFQAYLCGISTIIDDIYAPEKIECLKQRGYVMLKKQNCFLSTLLGD